jgi:hypothetical protein
VSISLNDGNDLGGDIVLGHWDLTQPTNLAFTPIANPAANPGNVNAVLVRAGREPARGNALEVYFGAFLGSDEASVTAEAVALSGGACTDCGVPLVFADCIIEQPDGSLSCGTELVFTSATMDNIGFTNLIPDDGSVNTPGIIDVLDGNCRGVNVGDRVGVGNGNNLTPRVIEAFEAYLARNGNRVTAPIISPASCPDPQFNQLQPIVGFATFTILEVSGPPNRHLRVALECDPDNRSPAPAGCDFFGTAGQTRLVR